MQKNRKNTIYAKVLLLLLCCVVGCSSSTNKDPTVSDSFWDFLPELLGGSSSPTENGTPVKPRNLKINPESGSVTLTWEIPKQYTSDRLNIGYRIFRKTGENIDAGTPWDFSSGSSLDWTYALSETVKASTCSNLSICSFTEKIGGPLSVDYAVIAYWDINSFRSGRSDPAFSNVITRTETVSLNFGEGFTQRLPRFLIGTIVDDLDRTPSILISKFSESVAELPWYLYEANESNSSIPQKRKFQASIFPSVSSDGLDMIVPDLGFNRALVGGRGKLSDCDVFPDLTKPLCYQILITKPLANFFAVGQQTDNLDLTYTDSPLPSSRTFKPRGGSWQFSKSGSKYLFVVDEQRILIRKDSIFSCRLDPGESGDEVYGSEGFCGFQWSIGTFSPAQRCAFDSSGDPIIGNNTCNPSDFEYSKKDSTKPSDYSLRFPGIPKIVGDDLYVPDSGNARVVKLKNWENAIKSCGRLAKPGEVLVNDFCKFSMVLGQGTNLEESFASRIEKRRCIKGGERGGFLGANPVPLNEVFLDPLEGIANGSVCMSDLYSDTGVIRKNRFASDFKSVASSDISPETGLLSERTKRMFRAPLMIESDSEGKIYILDAGVTRAKNEFGDREAVLPPRIMVWQKNPFSYQDCVPTNPSDAVPSCTIDTNLECTGVGCIDRECLGAECNATWFIGQPAELFGYNVASGKLPWEGDINPDAFPISSFGVASAGDMKGLWIVTGIDNRFIHFKDIKQRNIAPIIHNALDVNDDASTDFAIFKRGVFSGITVDTTGLVIIGWDSFLHIGAAWTGLLPNEK